MKTYPTRLDMIRDLPARQFGVEVGVQRGDFSEEILSIPDVRCLFLVDAWRPLNGDNPLDPAALNQGGHEENYRFVVRRFAREIARVDVIREASLDAAKLFDDRSLDFVFLDANHTYEAALADLRAWSPKVKYGGALMGHDYCDTEKSRAMGFGVMRAVDDFVASTGYYWPRTAVTEEEWPSFQLTSTP